jgi:hypothetical protein
MVDNGQDIWYNEGSVHYGEWCPSQGKPIRKEAEMTTPFVRITDEAPGWANCDRLLSSQRAFFFEGPNRPGLPGELAG